MPEDRAKAAWILLVCLSAALLLPSALYLGWRARAASEREEMKWAARLFALASAAFVAFGLILTKFAPPGVSLAFPVHGYRVIDTHVQTPCYFVAGLFAVFASLYRLSHLPFEKRKAQWHFWSSAVGASLFALGMVLLGHAGNNYTQHGPPYIQPSMAVLVTTAFGLIFGPPIFFMGQGLFLINLGQAIFAMTRRRGA